MRVIILFSAFLHICLIVVVPSECERRNIGAEMPAYYQIEPAICFNSSHCLTEVFEIPCSMGMNDFEMCKVEVTYGINICLYIRTNVYLCSHSVSGDRSKNFYMVPSFVIAGLTLSVCLMYTV